MLGISDRLLQDLLRIYISTLIVSLHTCSYFYKIVHMYIYSIATYGLVCECLFHEIDSCNHIFTIT